MTSQRPGIRILLVVSVLCAASWGLGEDQGRAAGVRPLGVVGAAGDTQAGLLTIRGHHLLPVEGDVQVKLAEQLLEVVSATPEEIQALLPAGLPRGTYLLQVLAGAEGSWAAPVTVGEVADGTPPDPVDVSLLRVREAHADLVAGTLLLVGESLGTSPDTTPTVTLSDVPLVVLSANEVEILARLPGGLRRTGFTSSRGGASVPASGALEAGTYRVRVVRTAPEGIASIWTDAMDVTTVSGGGTGDITAVNTPGGGGLQGGVASGDANLGLVGCYSGQVLKSDGSMWSCGEDADTGVNQVVGGGGVTGSILWRTLTLGSTATPTNTPGAIVARDGTGSFAAGTISLAGNLDLPNTTSPAVGVLTKGGVPFLHNSGTGTFVGSGAGNFSLTGYGNSAFGMDALTTNTTGYGNDAFGAYALDSNTTGGQNLAIGWGALNYHKTGYSNYAVGFTALWTLGSGDYNLAIGRGAGGNLNQGSHNIYIGNYGGAATESNTIRIGTTLEHTETYIAGIYGATPRGQGVPVYVEPDGQLGTVTSSRRYKDEIADMDAESDVLLKLRPVSFYYRPELDETHLRQYGLVAEEVAGVAPDLVAYDKDGTPQAVRYHFVNAMLLNEAQKQRRHIQDLEARLARLEAVLAGDR